MTEDAKQYLERLAEDRKLTVSELEEMMNSDSKLSELEALEKMRKEELIDDSTDETTN